MNELDRCESCREALGFYRWGIDQRLCDECFPIEPEED